MVIRQQKSRGRRKRGHNLTRKMRTTFTTYHVDLLLHMAEQEEEGHMLGTARSFLKLEHGVVERLEVEDMNMITRHDDIVCISLSIATNLYHTWALRGRRSWDVGIGAGNHWEYPSWVYTY